MLANVFLVNAAIPKKTGSCPSRPSLSSISRTAYNPQNTTGVTTPFASRAAISYRFYSLSTRSPPAHTKKQNKLENMRNVCQEIGKKNTHTLTLTHLVKKKRFRRGKPHRNMEGRAAVASATCWRCPNNDPTIITSGLIGAYLGQ